MFSFVWITARYILGRYFLLQAEPKDPISCQGKKHRWSYRPAQKQM